jgi:hypothetical protein
MNTRTKGQILEKYVCEQIRVKGLDNNVRPSFNSGATNTEKADIWTSLMILGQNIGIECKNQKRPAILEWWRQTQKLESLGREPVMVFKIHQEPLPATKCVIYLDTLLELLKENKELKENVKN